MKRFDYGKWAVLICGLFWAAAGISAPRTVVNKIDFQLADRQITTPEQLDRQRFQPLADKGLSMDRVPGKDLWLRLYLEPDQHLRNPVLFVPRVRYKMMVFEGGDSVYSFGIPEAPGDPAFLGAHHHEVYLSENAKDKPIYIRVVSDLKRVGLIGPLQLGDAASHLKWMWQQDLPKYIVGALFVILGIIFVLLYATGFREQVFLPFGFFGLVFGVFTLGRGYTRGQWGLSDELVWDYCQTFALFLSPACLIWFIAEAISRPAERRWIMLGAYIHAYYGVAAMALTLVGLVSLGDVLLPFQVLMLVSAVYGLLYTLQKAYQGDPNAKLLSEAFAFVSLTAIHDAATQLGILPWREMVSHYASLVFLVYLGILVKNRAGDSLTRHYHMIHELETTGFLQEKILPQKVFSTDHLQLEIFSRSAEAAGGDFFAYYPNGTNRFDLHIGDVTGHSTSASLLTAYVKGQLDGYYKSQQGQVNLKDLHHHLNDNLLMVGGESASASLLSVSFDLDRGEVCLSNSGHPEPILVDQADTATQAYFRKRNNCILGVLAAFQAKMVGPFDVTGNQVFLLCSDGFVESLNPTGHTPKRFRTQLQDIYSTYGEGHFVEHLAQVAQPATDRDDVTFMVLKVKRWGRKAPQLQKTS